MEYEKWWFRALTEQFLLTKNAKNKKMDQCQQQHV